MGELEDGARNILFSGTSSATAFMWQMEMEGSKPQIQWLQMFQISLRTQRLMLSPKLRITREVKRKHFGLGQIERYLRVQIYAN